MSTDSGGFRLSKPVKFLIVAVVLVGLCIWWVAEQFRAQDDPANAIDTCVSQVRQAVSNNGATWDGVSSVGPDAVQIKTSRDPGYSKGWDIQGQIPAGVLMYSDNPVTYTCEVYVNSKGEVLKSDRTKLGN